MVHTRPFNEQTNSVSRTSKPETSKESDTKVDKDVWAEAEHRARNMGGFAGISEEGKKKLTQEQYDQMLENDKNLKKWAGDSPILGDV